MHHGRRRTLTRHILLQWQDNSFEWFIANSVVLWLSFGSFGDFVTLPLWIYAGTEHFHGKFKFEVNGLNFPRKCSAPQNIQNDSVTKSPDLTAETYCLFCSYLFAKLEALQPCTTSGEAWRLIVHCVFTWERRNASQRIASGLLSFLRSQKCYENACLHP